MDPIQVRMTTQHGDPSPPMTTNHGHPPYAEMIIDAITALSDKDGSSKQAISNYIKNEFPNLPPTHSILLAHHLKRLKNLGQLVMVKYSYKLPSTSAQIQPPESTGYHPTLDFSENDANFDTVGFNSENSSKRKRGRPPKLKPSHELGLQSLENSSQRKRGRPPKVKPSPELGLQNQMLNVQEGNADVQSNQFHFHSHSQFHGGVGYGGSESLFAALGLSDDGVVMPLLPPTENTPVAVKRGRGRPPKSAGGSGGGGEIQAGVASSGGGDGEIQADVASSGGGGGGGDGETQAHVAGSGCSDGKIQGAEAVQTSAMMGDNGVTVKRGRGRPRRFGIGPVTVSLSGNSLGARGRPRKVNGGARPSVAINGGAGEHVFGLRRSARPSRKMSTNLIRKQPGGPNKAGLRKAVIVADPQQLVAYQQLKSKYELLQSKVKQVASMVKPCIDPEFGSTALRGLQELEELSSGEVKVNAPLLYLQN